MQFSQVLLALLCIGLPIFIFGWLIYSANAPAALSGRALQAQLSFSASTTTAFPAELLLCASTAA